MAKLVKFCFGITYTKKFIVTFGLRRHATFSLFRVCCASGTGGASSPNAGADLDNTDLVSWLNCECFFSLVLVGLLAALPFNLHTQELMQTPETYVARAIELSEEGAFDKVILQTAVRGVGSHKLVFRFDATLR